TTAPAADVEHGINECDYGHWQGRKLSDLSGEPLWSTIQEHPSAAVFPGGESLRNMQSRAVAAIRARAAQFDAGHRARDARATRTGIFAPDRPYVRAPPNSMPVTVNVPCGPRSVTETSLNRFWPMRWEAISTISSALS